MNVWFTSVYILTVVTEAGINSSLEGKIVLSGGRINMFFVVRLFEVS